MNKQEQKRFKKGEVLKDKEGAKGNRGIKGFKEIRVFRDAPKALRMAALLLWALKAIKVFKEIRVFRDAPKALRIEDSSFAAEALKGN